MKSEIAVTDLTTQVRRDLSETTLDAPVAPFDVAVPSGNSGAEPQRLDMTKARIAGRLIERYVNLQKEQSSARQHSTRQDGALFSETSAVKKRDEEWKTPFIRPVNWTRATTFSAVQEWEGVIISLTDDYIVANIVDLRSSPSRSTEQARIPICEIDEQDRHKLKVGRIYRWAIGYQRNKAGTKRRIANIVFRDLPQWTSKEVQEAKAQATEMAEYFASSSDVSSN